MSSQVNTLVPPPSTDAGPSSTAALEETALNPPPSPSAPVHGVKRSLDPSEWNMKGGKAARTKLRENAAPLRLAQKKRLNHFRVIQRQTALATAELATSAPAQRPEPAMQESTTPPGSPRSSSRMVLDTGISDDENDNMGSDTDEQEVDAIVDDYMAEDEDKGDGRMGVQFHSQPAPPVAAQLGPSQQGPYPVDRPAPRGLNQLGDASQHNTPQSFPVAAHDHHLQNSLPPHHYAPVPYQDALPHIPQGTAVGVSAPYPPHQTAGPVASSTRQPTTCIPGQHAQQHVMSAPVHHAQQHAIGIPSQYTQHGPGVPTMYAQHQAMADPSPFAQQHPLGVPSQYHPQRQAAYASVHPLQYQQTASHSSALPSSSAYAPPGNQQAGYTPSNPLSPSGVAPPKPPVLTSDRQFRSTPPVDNQCSARARPSQQSFQFVNVDPTQPPSERRRLTAANSLSSLPETPTPSVSALPVAAASVSRRKPPSKTSSSRNVAKERPRQPIINEQRYEPPRDPPAYEPPPVQPGASDGMHFGDHRAAGPRPNESGTSGPSRDPCREIVEKLSLLDEADRRRVMATLYPQERATEMDVDDDVPAPSKGKGKPRPDKVPALAMVLDKVQRVEDVCRDNAKRSKQFEAQVQVTLTQVQQEMAGLKNANPRASKHALQARRAVKPPRAPRQSRMKQIEEHLPPNFNTMAVADQEIWLRHQKDQLDLLGRHVRAHLKKVLGFSTWEELVKNNPPLSVNQIKLFANPKTSVLDVFPDRRLHFDFEQSWEKFSFNREASKLFVADFLSKVKAGQYSNPPVEPRYMTEHNVAIALAVYMDTCRRNYREVLDPVSDDEKERRADSSCKNGRRGTLLRQRKLTTGRRGWDQFDPLWEALTAANMSDDETDSGSKKGKEKVTRRRKRHWPTWTIIRSLWQSDELVKLFHGIDKHYRRDWENPGRYSTKRKSSGQPPRRRYLRETSKVEDGVVPRGLWRNCYNPAWLKTLQPDEIAALQIINADCDLKLPFPAADTDEESDGEEAPATQDEEME
ncbi:hypothetical protein GSI_08398 [Ganoderma sinense ZZ0214-1]|uniref:Uncharacterized protein n=1 Tax=Ganoderma sinense ZZ0214-1 TaxID=1077348 RepID=A0A2G8S6Q1_9APHY|nr:hypothetical protein GSI_08398 [Ganoderma sinense ZZ0214-1]